jgi:hypothetical protein
MAEWPNGLIALLLVHPENTPMDELPEVYNKRSFQNMDHLAIKQLGH